LVHVKKFVSYQELGAIIFDGILKVLVGHTFWSDERDIPEYGREAPKRTVSAYPGLLWPRKKNFQKINPFRLHIERSERLLRYLSEHGDRRARGRLLDTKTPVGLPEKAAFRPNDATRKAQKTQDILCNTL
jgi:hypothetical protein